MALFTEHECRAAFKRALHDPARRARTIGMMARLCAVKQASVKTAEPNRVLSAIGSAQRYTGSMGGPSAPGIFKQIGSPFTGAAIQGGLLGLGGYGLGKAINWLRDNEDDDRLPIALAAGGALTGVGMNALPMARSVQDFRIKHSPQYAAEVSGNQTRTAANEFTRFHNQLKPGLVENPTPRFAGMVDMKPAPGGGTYVAPTHQVDAKGNQIPIGPEGAVNKGLSQFQQIRQMLERKDISDRYAPQPTGFPGRPQYGSSAENSSPALDWNATIRSPQQAVVDEYTGAQSMADGIPVVRAAPGQQHPTSPFNVFDPMEKQQSFKSLLAYGKNREVMEKVAEIVASIGEKRAYFNPDERYADDQNNFIPISHTNAMIMTDPSLSPWEKARAVTIIDTAAKGQEKGMLSWESVAGAAVGAGAGYAGALVFGKLLSGIFGGMPASAQDKLRTAGAIAGALKGTGVI